MSSRRNFIKNTSLAGAGLTLTPNIASALIDDKLKDKKINVGLIGVGLRGTNHLNNLLNRKDVTISAICDIDKKRIDISKEIFNKKGIKQPIYFSSGNYDYKNLLDLKNIDAVIISTPWVWHTPMAIDAMNAKKYVGLEVAGAFDIQECWDLVNVHEKTGTHLMPLENVCYRRDVLAVLNMVRDNLFGELIHFRCGYQHDLRKVKFNNGKQPYGGGVEFGDKGMSEARWRTQHSVKRNGDLYPTHGLGPISVMTNINRGNRLLSISSFATKSVGLNNYIIKNGGKEHPNTKVKFNLGDVVTSTITTSNGETIIVTHDTNLPRPYSLGFRVQGSEGLWEVDGNRIYIEGKSENPHKWDDADKWLEKYDHPLWKKFSKNAEGSGHGGMDFYITNAFVESVKLNVAPPLDVYDAATWAVVTPLSEVSIANNGEPQDFPDFTKGRWVNRKPYNWIKDTY